MNPLSFNVFGFITVIALAVVFLIFAMKYAAAMVQTRVQLANETSYRDLAALALKTQEANSALLSDIALRLASVEKLLKEVG